MNRLIMDCLQVEGYFDVAERFEKESNTPRTTVTTATAHTDHGRVDGCVSVCVCVCAVKMSVEESNDPTRNARVEIRKAIQSVHRPPLTAIRSIVSSNARMMRTDVM